MCILHGAVIEGEAEFNEGGAGEFDERAKVSRVAFMETGVATGEGGEIVAVGDWVDAAETGMFE